MDVIISPPGPAEKTAKIQRGRPFGPGKSGNPQGRPKGSRDEARRTNPAHAAPRELLVFLLIRYIPRGHERIIGVGRKAGLESGELFRFFLGQSAEKLG
jgi:Family of unknown function (DUF5681)